MLDFLLFGLYTTSTVKQHFACCDLGHSCCWNNLNKNIWLTFIKRSVIPMLLFLKVAACRNLTSAAMLPRWSSWLATWTAWTTPDHAIKGNRSLPKATPKSQKRLVSELIDAKRFSVCAVKQHCKTLCMNSTSLFIFPVKTSDYNLIRRI